MDNLYMAKLMNMLSKVDKNDLQRVWKLQTK